MMWLAKGLKKGTITTKFPKEEDKSIPKSLYDKDCGFFCFNSCMNGCEERDDEIEVRRKIPFNKSVHIFVLDVGSCSSCNREISLLNSPQYDLHRLGFFFTPVPRHADILLVIGEPTEKMIPVLKEAYEQMPEPKIVMTTGACANEKIEKIIKVDARVSGCPPQPIAILKALLMLTGRWNP